MKRTVLLIAIMSLVIIACEKNDNLTTSFGSKICYDSQLTFINNHNIPYTMCKEIVQDYNTDGNSMLKVYYCPSRYELDSLLIAFNPATTTYDYTTYEKADLYYLAIRYNIPNVGGEWLLFFKFTYNEKYTKDYAFQERERTIEFINKNYPFITYFVYEH